MGRKRYWVPIDDLYRRFVAFYSPKKRELPPIYGYHPTQSLVLVSRKVWRKVMSFE